ncbi:hypothetical protein PLICRDRAFT_411327 [Plicaturopsis crispa FD-325 SS-3]|nr:hypothetical protein PLICRDRAFT_411327 [Plicaturopsis crispa FD-325 SS-3]
MFAPTRRLPSSLSLVSCCRTAAGASRSASTAAGTPSRRSKDDDRSEGNKPRFVAGPSYWDWIANPENTREWEQNTPRNFLGKTHPFPLNPSFKPPIPVSDKLRTKIYVEFMTDPQENNVRVLSDKYQLSLKRVDAILRLKGLEAHWIKEKKTVQTGFVKGMEGLLGCSTLGNAQEERNPNYIPGDDSEPEFIDIKRYDVTLADKLDEVDGDDKSRLRYQRMFWEPVAESDEDAIMPEILERARQDQIKAKDEARLAKSGPKYLPRSHPHVPQVEGSGTELYTTKPGHVTIKFVDVGGKFLDVHDVDRRRKEGERRRNRRIARREKNTL